MIYFIIIYTFKKQNKNFFANKKVLNSCEEIGINHRTLILQHLIILDSNNSHFFIQLLRICLKSRSCIKKAQGSSNYYFI